MLLHVSKHLSICSTESEDSDKKREDKIHGYIQSCRCIVAVIFILFGYLLHQADVI